MTESKEGLRNEHCRLVFVRSPIAGCRVRNRCPECWDFWPLKPLEGMCCLRLADRKLTWERSVLRLGRKLVRKGEKINSNKMGRLSRCFYCTLHDSPIHQSASQSTKRTAKETELLLVSPLDLHSVI